MNTSPMMTSNTPGSPMMKLSLVSAGFDFACLDRDISGVTCGREVAASGKREVRWAIARIGRPFAVSTFIDRFVHALGQHRAVVTPLERCGAQHAVGAAEKFRVRIAHR